MGIGVLRSGGALRDCLFFLGIPEPLVDLILSQTEFHRQFRDNLSLGCLTIILMVDFFQSIDLTVGFPGPDYLFLSFPTFARVLLLQAWLFLENRDL